MSVGYQRRRTTLGGAIEGHLVTIVLLVAGVLVTVFVVNALLRLLGLHLLGQ